jgi:alkyl sulfatase BDS1-like metallo-beta-lactamase superfamily hydrolase
VQAARRSGIVLALLAAAGCDSSPQPVSFAGIETPADLARHSGEFAQRIVEVTDGVHVAIGYGLANAILIEGADGAIVVDTLSSMDEGRAVREAFREITGKPVRALIYTHNHADHIMGARAFADSPDIPVYAHATTTAHIDRVLNILRPVLTARSQRMFGSYLDPAGLVNAGIGPRLGLGPDSEIGILRPTHVFDDALETEIAGIRLRLEHAPGETDDQILVWLPDRRVLLPGDNIYKAFPNLYTIRGTGYRNVRAWVASLDRMRQLAPEHLVPSHTRPLSGAEDIQAVLTDYRDAIQFVHDQTIRGMNQGLTADELASRIALPGHLAASPWLQEFYGTVTWSVRNIFSGHLGWFDGNPTRLYPLPPRDEAARWANLAGGYEPLLAAAETALARNDYQWVLEITDRLLRLDPSDPRPRNARVTALTALGELQGNPNARHYYLTTAAELGDGLTLGQIGVADAETLRDLPMGGFFQSLSVNLDAEKSAETLQSASFAFPDSGEQWSVIVRRGVAEIREGELADADFRVAVDSLVWKQMLAGTRNPAMTVATDMDIEGGRVAFLEFLSMFRPPR